MGVDARVVRVTVTPTGAGLEADAREARYSALAEHRSTSEVVLLGHTLDDQAETVLLGLARGSGVRSLAECPRPGEFVRPLLGLGREVTASCCAEQGLTPWRDPHNEDQRFARVRVRTRVMPVLEDELGPGVRESLARTAELARADADLLDSLTPPVGGEDPSALWLAGLDPALRGRYIREWLLARREGDVAAVHVSAIDELVTGGQKGSQSRAARHQTDAPAVEPTGG